MAAAGTLTANQLAKAIADLSLDFYQDDNKQRYENYIGLDKLCSEFLWLGLPKESDILNPMPGPGIMAARLQSKGFVNLDAVDSDCGTLKKMRDLGLFRNYICRNFNGVNTTGLKEDVYDAVLTIGGVTPDGVHELLRITRPDGVIMWTLRADDHSRKADYALLGENLISLEKAGKCVIHKMAEHFEDSHSGLEGLLYMVRVLETPSFDPRGVPEGHTLPSLLTTGLQAKEATEGAGQEYYDEWADKEEDMVLVGHYTGHVKLCQAFFKLRMTRNVEILDVSSHVANPGLVGTELSHHGYVCVDGVETNQANLPKLRALGAYRNIIPLDRKVSEMGSIPVNDNSYDVILMASGFAPGRVGPSAFPELLRVLRPGGYILWTMRDGYGAHDPDFALFDVKVNDLVDEHKWELLVGPVFFDNFALHHAGRFYMLRKEAHAVHALGSRTPQHYTPQGSPTMARRRFGSRSNSLVG